MFHKGMIMKLSQYKGHREKAEEMVRNREHIIYNNYACDSQIPNNITTDDIHDTAREIVYYS